MLDYKLVNYKPTVKRKNVTYIDLMANSFVPLNTNDGQYILVSKYYIARPDLISLAVYGSDDYADIICKINGISNPFELNENMLLFCPAEENIMTCYKYDSHVSDMISDQSDEIGKKVTNYQKEKNSKRSPNEQTIGEQNFIIDKSLGLVFY